MTALVAVVCGLLGLVAGGFVDALVYRVPRDMQSAGTEVEGAPAGCPQCGHLPGWQPRCPECGRSLRLRSWLTRLAVAGLFVGAAVRFHGSLAIVAYCIGFAGLTALSVIDVDTKLLPKRLVWPTAGAVLVVFVL